MPYGDSTVRYGNHTACIICGKPVPKWRGSFNIYRTPLCANPACKHERKLQKQRERRADRKV